MRSLYFKTTVFFCLFFLGIIKPIRAAVIDTITVDSPSMKKGVRTVVIKPEKKAPVEGFPVVYLLHGYSGNHQTWVTLAPNVQRLSDLYSLIIVCPDGSFSWYWDSPLKSDYRYETFISTELPAYIDSHFPTAPHREARAITGLSMGGHGALWNALRHPSVFGAGGSMSGGVDIRPFPDNWQMKELIGQKKDNPRRWDDYSVINQLDNVIPGAQALMIDCGYDDFFFQVNETFHAELLKRKIPHDYITRPGAHNWTYWSNAVKYQILFFSDYFNTAR